MITNNHHIRRGGPRGGRGGRGGGAAGGGSKAVVIEPHRLEGALPLNEQMDLVNPHGVLQVCSLPAAAQRMCS